MNLDIRYPIGYLFLVIGTILVVYGLVSDPAIYAVHSLGVNINLWWGAFQIVFGGVMVGLARRGARKKDGEG
jgi:hypothetical protein